MSDSLLFVIRLTDIRWLKLLAVGVRFESITHIVWIEVFDFIFALNYASMPEYN